jgi:biopolymer transport protein ExbD
MKLKRKALPRPRIEMLPLIDIVFLLLVFFIYAMLSMAVHRGMDANLPGSTRAAVRTAEAPLSLAVKTAPDGLDIYLNTERIDIDDLQDRLRHAVGRINKKPSPELLLFADKTVTYQQLYHVLDQVNGAGIKKVSLQAVAEKP